jgi:hypothetical protein
MSWFIFLSIDLHCKCNNEIKKPLLEKKRYMVNIYVSHLPEIYSAGFGTIPHRAGCRSFTGPVPPLLWIRAMLLFNCWKRS